MSESTPASAFDLQRSIEGLLDAATSVDFSAVREAVHKTRIDNPKALPEDIAKTIIGQQSLMSGLLGAGTGLLGAPFLVATLPADLVKTLKLQTFTIHSVAYAYGYSAETTDFKTDAALILSNNSFEEIARSLDQMLAAQMAQSLKELGVELSPEELQELNNSGSGWNLGAAVAQATTKSAATTAVKFGVSHGSKHLAKAAVRLGGNALRDHALKSVPKLLRGMAWSLGAKKIAEKTIQRGVSRAVPVLGAVVGGGMDWWTIQQVGNVAIDYYKNNGPEHLKALTENFGVTPIDDDLYSGIDFDEGNPFLSSDLDELF